MTEEQEFKLQELELLKRNPMIFAERYSSFTLSEQQKEFIKFWDHFGSQNCTIVPARQHSIQAAFSYWIKRDWCRRVIEQLFDEQEQILLSKRIAINWLGARTNTLEAWIDTIKVSLPHRITTLVSILQTLLHGKDQHDRRSLR